MNVRLMRRYCPRSLTPGLAEVRVPTSYHFQHRLRRKQRLTARRLPLPAQREATPPHNPFRLTTPSGSQLLPAHNSLRLTTPSGSPPRRQSRQDGGPHGAQGTCGPEGAPQVTSIRRTGHRGRDGASSGPPKSSLTQSNSPAARRSPLSAAGPRLAHAQCVPGALRPAEQAVV